MKLKLPTLSRRDFLAKSSLGAGLALSAPSILRAKEAGAPADDIRVGFIGCGKQHEVLFNAMVNIPGIRYVAAADIMKARVGRTFSAIKSRFDTNINRYLDVEEMLEKDFAVSYEMGAAAFSHRGWFFRLAAYVSRLAAPIL